MKNIYPDGMKKCPQCCGDGYWIEYNAYSNTDEPEMNICIKCEGKGFIVNPFAKVIFED